jgi:predicted MPP superfamily phosphohydrolase
MTSGTIAALDGLIGLGVGVLPSFSISITPTRSPVFFPWRRFVMITTPYDPPPSSRSPSPSIGEKHSGKGVNRGVPAVLNRNRIKRRRFLKHSVAALGAGLAGCLGWTFWIEPFWVEIVERPLPLRNLPDHWVGKTVVQISDLHVCNLLDLDFMRRSLASIAELDPELVVITGDFMTCERDEWIDTTARVMESLRPGRAGILAVPGNHDYGAAWDRPEVAECLGQRLGDLGIRLLRNQVVNVNDLQIIGLDDLWSGCLDAAKVWPRVDPNRASLVLCHNPDAADLPIWSGYQGWILAGHTHGGQCKPPFLPPPLLPVRNRRYTSGAFDLYDGRWLYINRALGYLRQVRFNVRPEITRFILVRDATPAKPSLRPLG